MLSPKKEDSFVITQNAPFTKTVFCVLQGLLVTVYYLMKFSRHDTFVLYIPCCTSANLEILAPSEDMHNIHFVLTILYLQGYKNLIEKHEKFLFF